MNLDQRFMWLKVKKKTQLFKQNENIPVVHEKQFLFTLKPGKLFVIDTSEARKPKSCQQCIHSNVVASFLGQFFQCTLLYRPKRPNFQKSHTHSKSFHANCLFKV